MNLPDQMQAWPDESREQVADLMFYWRAGVGLERIASELALDHCYVRRALLLYRSEKSEPIASILREVQIGDIAELRRSYLLIQKPVLWQRVTGKPMSEEESKFLKLVIEMSIPPHELPNYNANFWDRGALSIQVRTALLSTAERERFLEF